MNLPKTFWVEGTVGSTTMRDAKIKAEPVGNPAGADDVSFTVLWVDVVVATSGYVSDDNEKRDSYYEWTDVGTAKLELQRYGNGDDRMGWGTEARGSVSPGDFEYPGSNLKLERDIDAYYYGTNLIPQKVKTFGDAFPYGNDTSPLFWRDDNPVDSRGFIYDLDALGLPVPNMLFGTKLRVRANIRSYASIKIDSLVQRASGIYSYYIRFSMLQSDVGIDDNWVVIMPPDVIGDNDAFGSNGVLLSQKT